LWIVFFCGNKVKPAKTDNPWPVLLCMSAARARLRACWCAKHDTVLGFAGGGRPGKSNVQTSAAEGSMWLCVPAAACKKWHLDPSTTTVNHGQTPAPATLTDGFMRNQRGQLKE
jgi:hypothetical protein